MSKIIIFISTFISGAIVTALAWYGIALAVFGLSFILFDPSGWIFAMLSLMAILNLVLIPLAIALLRVYFLARRHKLKGFNCGCLLTLLIITGYVGAMIIKILHHQIIKPL